MAAAVVADRPEQPAEVASKVLRRAQVSKMARALQSRLALANVKTKHGWENYSIDTLEREVEIQLKRKRPASANGGALSDTSSCISDRFSTGVLDSSPLAAPIFSDQVYASGGSSRQSKRARAVPPTRHAASSNHTRTKVRTSTTAAKSWKASYHLPESSPVYHRRHTYYPSSTHAPTLSFVSGTSTVPDDLNSLLSEDDDEDLPIHSFQMSSNIRSSPPPRSPRTPPPALARSARMRNDPFQTTTKAHKGEEEAGLLMFLATSPSPAQGGTARQQITVPSTPPTKSTPLPSSMMSTPGGVAHSFPNYGFATPGTNLNFADFLNMTPSPAQINGSWNRTPAAGKTPLAAREARRRINFDSLVPPGASPSLNGSFERNTVRLEGLGMDLGGELAS